MKERLDHTNQLVYLKLDSGAELNLVNKSVSNSLHQSENVQQADTKLTFYASQNSNVLGNCILNVSHKDNKTLLEFYVVNSKASCSLGLETCVKDNLMKKVDSL